MRSTFLFICLFLFCMFSGVALNAQNPATSQVQKEQDIPPVFFLHPSDRNLSNYWDNAVLRIISAMPEAERPKRYISKESSGKEEELPQPYLLAERTTDRNAAGLFAASGFILAVHKDNPVSEISISNFERILNGSLGSWVDDRKKTHIHFYLLKDHNILPSGSKQFRLIDKNPANLLAKAQDDKDALLILPLNRLMLKGFKLLKVESVEPSMENILSNRYPLSHMFRLRISAAAPPVLHHVESELRSQAEAAEQFRAGLIPLSRAAELKLSPQLQGK